MLQVYERRDVSLGPGGEIRLELSCGELVDLRVAASGDFLLRLTYDYRGRSYVVEARPSDLQAWGFTGRTDRFPYSPAANALAFEPRSGLVLYDSMTLELVNEGASAITLYIFRVVVDEREG